MVAIQVPQAGKEKRIALGVYPDVGLKDAREKLDEIRKQLASNIDPSEIQWTKGVETGRVQPCSVRPDTTPAKEGCRSHLGRIDSTDKRKFEMKKTLVYAGVLVTLLSGCATILNDDTQPINVTASNNKEVSGTIDGQTFKTPAIVNVTRENKNKIIAVSTEGCAKETSLESSVDSKFFINILSGGLFGSSTDYGSGEMWRYSENIVIQCQ